MAWLAGFVDGEGCFLITPATSSYKGRKYLHAVFMLSNTDKRLIDRCIEITGLGKARSRSTKPECKNAYEWRITGEDVSNFAELLLPYLVSKHEQAELAIVFRETMMFNPTPLPGQRGMQPTPDDLAADKTVMQLAMRALNHRGSRPVPAKQRLALETVRIWKNDRYGKLLGGSNS